MSLLATASEFNSSNSSNNKKKKRVSTMGGEISNIQCVGKDDSLVTDMADDTADNENKNKRVLNLMNRLSPNNDGTNLENFVPLSNPEITMNKIDVVNDDTQEGMSPSNLLPANLQPESSKFRPNNIKAEGLSNLTETYNGKMNFKPLARETSNMGQDKLSEKINYMIHLLEQQQSEKTDNVMEEFILYMFLGVFVIFTVDSFTRAGRYVR
jgi:hypothetical protein